MHIPTKARRHDTIRTIAAVVLLCLAGGAVAADCGGGVPCQCGDTVKGAAVLEAPVGTCPGVGLVVTSGAVLDCAGYTLTGSNLPGAWYGIHVDGASGAVVQNCRVTSFRRGIRLRGGGGNALVGNEVFGNRYGIDLAEATSGNRIVLNAVHDNRDEGIHVGTGVTDAQISGNRLIHNKYENLYLLGASGCTVSGNLLSAAVRGAPLYLKHSSRNTFTDNEVRAGMVLVRGASEGNRFERTRVISNGFLFQAYLDSTLGWTYPHDNAVVGGYVSTTDYCLRFAGAYDNRVTDVTIDRCTPVLETELGGQAPTGNVIDVHPAS